MSVAVAQGYGIDLMAMNDDRDMQPLVKGSNLAECLKETMAAVHDLRDIFLTFLDYNRTVPDSNGFSYTL